MARQTVSRETVPFRRELTAQLRSLAQTGRKPEVQ